MAIAYSGGTLVKTTVTGATAAGFVSAVNSAMVSAGWTSAAIANGYSLTSATTPSGLAMKLKVYTETSGTYNGYPAIQGTSIDGSAVTALQHVYVTSGRSYEFIANRYSVWLYLLGSFRYNNAIDIVNGVSNAFAAGVPYLPEPVQPLSISAATNATPIAITTTANHGMLTGDSCYIQNAGGNTAANGLWTITKTSDTAFTLDTSVGNGVYTSGGIVGNRERISRCFYVWGQDGSYTLPCNGWRYLPDSSASGVGGSSISSFCVNEQNYGVVGTNPVLFAASSYPWRGGRFTITEPYLRATNTGSGNALVQAQLYNAAIVTGSVAPAGDSVFTADSHNWVVYNEGGSGVLCLAVVTT